jgi:hypothetical protein
VISCGFSHTIALKTDGTLWAWGGNGDSQIGNGGSQIVVKPLQIGSDTDWKAISCGNAHTVALKTDGTLWAWGYNEYGQLGNGNTSEQNHPIQIGSETNWAVVSSGEYHTVAIKTDGTLWAWGYNSAGQLGDGTQKNKSTPVLINIDTNWQSLSSGLRHTNAIKTDGTLWGWGDGVTNGVAANKFNPAQIGSETNWAMLSSGEYHTVAIKADGTLWAWGRNSSGELGDGTSENKSSPVQIGRDTTWETITCGSYYTVALNHGNVLPILTLPSNSATDISTNPIFDWSNATGSISYRIEVAETHDFANKVIETFLTSSDYNSTTTLSNETLYYWRVKSYIQTDSSDWSETFSFTTEPVAGIQDATKQNMTLKPNPSGFQTELIMNFKILDDISIELYDNTGKLLRQIYQGQYINSLIIDTSDLPSGSYQIMVKSKNKMETAKLIIVK